jgi:hypothetical protein
MKTTFKLHYIPFWSSVSVTWVKHAACANVGGRNASKVVFEKLEGRHQLRRLVIVGMMMMMMMIKSNLKGTGFYEEEWSDVAGVVL